MEERGGNGGLGGGGGVGTDNSRVNMVMFRCEV